MGVRPPLPALDLDHILEHTEGLWNEIRGERLFVTGGTGFFGGWMLESLLHADRKLGLGTKATVLTRDSNRYRAAVPHVAEHPTITLWAGNVRDFELPEGAFSHVLHLATETDLAADLGTSFTTAVLGTRRVLELAAQSGTQRLLLASSGAVYGTQPPELERLDEDYPGAPNPLDPASGYGQGKRAAEFLCAAAASSSLEVKIARCFAFVGPLLPLDANFAVGNFIRDALAGRPIRVHGDGTALRSYLYAADLAIWLWTILLRGVSGRAYNVGSDAALSIADLAQLVGDAILTGGPVVIAETPNPRRPLARYVPSVQRATAELGLHPYIELREAIRRTAEWHS